MPDVVVRDTFSGWNRGEMTVWLAQQVGSNPSDTVFMSVAHGCIKRAVAKVHGYKRWRFLRDVDIEYTLTAEQAVYDLAVGDDAIPGLVDVSYIGQNQFPETLTQLTLKEYRDRLGPSGGTGVPDAWYPITWTKIQIYPTPETAHIVLISGNLGMGNLTDDSQRGQWPSRFDHVILGYAEYYIRKWRRHTGAEIADSLGDAKEALKELHFADNVQPGFKSRIRHEREDRNRYSATQDRGRDLR